MLVFFKAQFFKIIKLIIYIFSFIESKIILLKKNYFSKKIEKEYFYYKNKELIDNCNINYDYENEYINYDKKIIVNNKDNFNYSYIYEINNSNIKNPIKNKNYFITITINITENNCITSYTVSLRNPLNFYFTNTQLLCYEHVHFLMNYNHNIEINNYTIYNISVMDKNFELKDISSNQYVEFDDLGNYEIKNIN